MWDIWKLFPLKNRQPARVLSRDSHKDEFYMILSLVYPLYNQPFNRSILYSGIYIFFSVFRKAQKAKADKSDLGNFDNPTYAGQKKPVFFMAESNSLSLPSPQTSIPNDYGTGATGNAESHVYDNPEMLVKPTKKSSDYSELPPSLPERNLSSASDPFSEYSSPLGQPRPVLPDLVDTPNGHDVENSPAMIKKTWPPPGEEACGKLPNVAQGKRSKFDV